MFGPVSKIVWQKQYTVGNDNLALIYDVALLIHTDEKTIIIDTGLGNTLGEKLQKIYQTALVLGSSRPIREKEHYKRRYRRDHYDTLQR